MKVKIIEAVDFITIYPIIKDMKLKFSTLYKVSKYFDACSKERDFYVENLNKIFDKYGERDESGGFKLTEDKTGIIIQDDKRDECNKELEDLMAIEVEIAADPLKIEELENLELDLATYAKIKPFIAE